MSEKILIPLDGSDLGEAAVNYVCNLISRMSPKEKTSVVLLHVITKLTHSIDLARGSSEVISVPYTADELERMKEKSNLYLKNVSEKLIVRGASIETISIVGGNPAEEIINAEEKCGCDLVAMSTHGRSGLSRWAYGSVTDKVLRAGKVPVLLVRSLNSKK